MASQNYYTNGEQQMHYQQQPQQGYGYEGQQQQQYTQAPPNYNPNGNYSRPPTGEKQSFDQAFKLEKPKYNDLWAGILLILVFLGFTAVSGVSLNGFAKNHSGDIYGNANQFTLNSNTIILFAFVLLLAFVLSWAYLIAARLFTKQFIWLTGILNIVVGFATAVYYLYRKQYAAGIVFLIFAAFTVFCFISWIPRIPFSVVMLQTSVDIARNYGHVFLVSALGGFVALVFAAWYSVTLVAVYVTFAPDSSTCKSGSPDCSYAKVIGILVFITFAAYVSSFSLSIIPLLTNDSGSPNGSRTPSTPQ